MTETVGEQLHAAWLEEPKKAGRIFLPLLIGHDTPKITEAETGELSLTPLDFSADGMDIFTNFLCYGAGSAEQPCLTKYCFLTTAQLKSNNMMSLESVDQILGWAQHEGSPITTLSLLGREFALHPEAKEIIRRVFAAGFNMRIVTNGSVQFQALLDDEEIVAMLRDESRDNLIAVSLDSLTEAENDKNRGPGAAKLIFDTIKKLNRPGLEIPFRINASPLLNCIDGLPDLYAGAIELGAKSVLVHFPDAVGRGRSLIPGPQSSRLSEQPGREVWAQIRAQAEGFNNSHPDSNNFVRCEVGFGEVNTCHMVERKSSLHFAPQITDDEGTFIPVATCAFSMEEVDTLSSHVMRSGILHERKGLSQLSIARRQLGRVSTCPLYPGRACIYDRGE